MLRYRIMNMYKYFVVNVINFHGSICLKDGVFNLNF